ncbi:MAG: response regulator [Bdellovibrionales bacterium]|nr:response regulator [Bdellovibrionales bacterium]
MKNKNDYKILIIDDEIELLNVTTAYLKIMGYTYLTAVTGLQGLEILSKEKIDLVICDLVLPQLTGEEIFRKLDGSSKASPAFIFCSGLDSPFKGCLPANILAFVQKPFSMKELMMIIDKHYQLICVV